MAATKRPLLLVFVSVFAAMFQLLGCSSEPAASGPAGAPSHAVFIAVLGSSTAAGYGLTDPSASWVARYTAFLDETRPSSRLLNLAVSGYTTFQVVPTGTTSPPNRPPVDEAHNVSAALAENPDAIIVNLPSNDAAFGFSVDETMGNLRAIAGVASAQGIPIWVCSSQPRNLAPSGMTLLESLRDQTFAEFGDHALDFWTPLAAPDGKPLAEFNQGDGIHPNAEGHRLLFETARTAAIPEALEGR